MGARVAITQEVPKVMLCASIAEGGIRARENDDRWVMEPKYDGFRLLTVMQNPPSDLWDEWMDGSSVKAEGYSRARKNQLLGGRLPHIKGALEDLPGVDVTLGRTVLDGELNFYREGMYHTDCMSHVAGVMKS